MSIVQSLKKILDPVKAGQEDRANKKLQQEVRQEVAGDPPRYVCSACGLESSDHQYCPSCLADTMGPLESDPLEPAPRRPKEHP